MATGPDGEPVNFVDLLLIAGLLLVALIGWRAGLIATALGFAGFLAGALVAAVGIPALLTGRNLPPLLSTVAVLAGMVVAGLLGQALFGWLGRTLREAITFKPVRWLDSVGGLAMSTLAFAVASWLLLSVLASVPVAGTSEQVRTSRTYSTLERFMATPTEGLLGQVRGLLDSLDLPRIPFNEALLPPVTDPGDISVSSDAQAAARDLVVQVSAQSQRCRRDSSGSGVIVAPNLVVTNSHVIAGSQQVRVQRYQGGAPRLPATVVYRDAGLDIAVLRVGGLSASRVARWVESAPRGTEGAVAGYPLGGGLKVRPARVRGQASVVNDIGPGNRDVYVFRGRVQPGNSGGALLDQQGRVIGVVFASAEADENTGFALTAADAQKAIRVARDRTEAVGTGACPVE